MGPDWYPGKSKILANERTQIGDVDTKKFIDLMPMGEYAFDTTYTNTTGDEKFYGFNNKLYDYCVNEAVEFPWSYGAYQFYEMDDEKKKYKFLTYVNVTSPFATQLYPQYMIESVLKSAFDNEDFEFKVRTTPFPAT